jgi:Plant transposon protein
LEILHASGLEELSQGLAGFIQRQRKKSTIVLEAISDYHLWFWHASFGYAGSLNDLNILNLSPFLSSLLDGSFIAIEKECIPCEIAGKSFESLYVCVDVQNLPEVLAICARGYKHPITVREKNSLSGR